MNLIDENYKPFDISIGGDVDLFRHYFEFDYRNMDMMLKRSHMWYHTAELTWYTLKIGKNTIELPEHMHLMVADYLNDEVDWIRVEELIDREMTTFVYTIDLEPDSWVQEEVRVTSVSLGNDRRCQLPFTSNAFPVALGDRHSVLISEKDIYVQTKTIDFPNFYKRKG